MTLVSQHRVDQDTSVQDGSDRRRITHLLQTTVHKPVPIQFPVRRVDDAL